MSTDRERGLIALMVLNLMLQLFDGVATYAGVTAGYGEGNPLVAWAIELLGPAAALSLVKVQACGWLLLLWALRRRSALAAPALAATATSYLALSFGPWSALLVPLYVLS